MYRESPLFRKAPMLLVLIIAVGLMAGCQTLKQFVRKPAVSFDRMAIEGMSLFEATAVFMLKVENPNPIGIRVSGLTYDLELEEKPFVKGNLDKGVSIAAMETESVAIPVTVNYMDLFDSVSGYAGKDEIAYELSGTVDVMGFALPYRSRGSLPVPDLPKVSLRSVDVSGFSISGASVVFEMAVKNDNSFGVGLNGLDYAISLGGLSLADGRAKVGALDEKGTRTVSVPVNVDFFKLGRSAYRLLSGENADYALSGDMVFSVPGAGDKRIPFARAGRVPLSMAQ